MSEKTASQDSITVPNKQTSKRKLFVRLYITSILLTGIPIIYTAFANLPEDTIGLLLFITMGVLAEATSVELFNSSHSQVSMSSVVVIASIITLGPMAGPIVYLACALATAMKMHSDNRGKKTSILLRTSFNAGMLIFTGFVAGQVFAFLGGNSSGLISLSNIIPLISTTLVEYHLNIFLLIGIIFLQTGQSPIMIWKRDFRWQSKIAIIGGILGSGFLAVGYNSLGILGIAIVLLPILATSYAFRLYKNNMKVYVEGLESLNTELKETLSALEKSNQELTDSNQAVRRLNADLYKALAKVFDMRDPYVGGHAAQVATYAVAIATEMGLPSERIEIIRQSAYLHDIGKLAIPEAILHKPGKLTDIEYEFIKKHTDIGADLLASTEGLKRLAPIVRHHHERWDGHGYPLGLAGNDIPLESRILNVCDSVESMASDRPYHRGMSNQEILAELKNCARTQFDPEIVKIFVNIIKQHGDAIVVNSARSVTQQYAASLLTNESLTHNMFAWVLEKEAVKQTVSTEGVPPVSS
jgi:putative nucleotidyltransferase with HDIG domain